MRTESDLLQPFALGSYLLRNRIVMAPMTRHRAVGRLPGPMTVEYYAQRASAGLIVSESTAVSLQGASWLASPGIYDGEQVSAWRQVTDAVHEKGGVIFCQLFHCGRCSCPQIHPLEQPPVAPSAIAAAGSITVVPGAAPSPYMIPRALDTNEIPSVVEQFRTAALNAKHAGFDGIEIHAANGFLIDQFLRDGSNHRTDRYGGSVENRVRLVQEVTEAVLAIFQAGQVGVRISPINGLNGMSDSDPESLYLGLCRALNAYGKIYLHVVEGALGTATRHGAIDTYKLRQSFVGTYIANNGYTFEKANVARSHDRADLISFGRYFISNPDLVERFRRSAPLNDLDASAAAAQDERGYTDYPPLEESKVRAAIEAIPRSPLLT